MSEQVASIDIGLRMAGVVYTLVLFAGVWRRTDGLRMALVPAIYLVSLAAALTEPAAREHFPPSLETAVWAVSTGLAPATYLFVIQLIQQAVPERRHFWVLSVPALAVPLIYTAVHLGDRSVCSPALSGCVPVAPLVNLIQVMASAAVLLLLLIATSDALGMGGPDGRLRRALARAIVGLHVVMLAVWLGELAGVFTEGRSMLAAAIIQLTLLYIVGSSLFRLRDTGSDAGPESRPAAGVLKETPADSGEPAMTPADWALVSRVRDLMTYDKLYQHAGLARRDLAAELEVPEHRLSKVVNAGFDQSVSDLLNGYRVAEAKDWLTNSDRPITDIAYDVGFNSVASFNRVFRQHAGQSPTAFRAAQSAESDRDTLERGAGAEARPATGRTRGFTLIEVAVLLTVLGLVAGAALQVSRPAVEAERRDVTEQRLKAVREALVAYAGRNARLPCPADASAGIDAGRARPSAPDTTTDCDTGDAISGVPWRTLGLQRQQARDAWGRMLVYRVYDGADGLTRADGITSQYCSCPGTTCADAGGDPGAEDRGGTIPDCDSENQKDHINEWLRGKGLTVLNAGDEADDDDPWMAPDCPLDDQDTHCGGAAFVLLSVGSNGLGGYGTSGVRLPEPASDEEMENWDGDTTHWTAQPSEEPDTYFDDILVVLSLDEFTDEAGLR